MKKKLLLVLAASLMACLLAGCLGVVAVGAGAAALSAADRRTTGTQVEDERIELVTGNRFSERFGDKAHINVTSYNRTVLLTGEVPDEKMKADAEGIVRGLPNVKLGIVNDLQVAGVSSLSARANDSGITGKVKARFLDSSKFSPLVIKVVTEASVVYLLGIVTEEEANASVEVARTTGGVRKVVKVFDYCKTTDPACAPPAKKEEPKK
jgi:osmotically-inducible protein OsmY